MFELVTSDIQITEQPLMGIVRLQRSRPNRGQVMAEVAGILASQFPTKVGQIEPFDDGKQSLWCLSPDKWLLFLPYENADEIASRVSGRYYADEISDQYVSLICQGDGVLNLLAKGSSVDFREGHFQTGTFVTTLFAQITVIIENMTEGPGYRLLVDGSYASYLCNWLQVSCE